MPPRKGGALISEGAYGCVYAPALPCAAKGAKAAIQDVLTASARAKMAAAKLDAKPLVTKLFESKEDLDVEWERARLIAAVDPEQKYFIYATKQCTVQRANAAREKVALTSRRRKCSLLDYDPSKQEYAAAVIPDGGRPLHHWITDRLGTARLADVCAMLLPLMKGLDLLAANKIIYQDLKANNVVVDAAGRAKIIDFGLNTTFDALFIRQRNHLAYKRYWLLPPEIRIARRLNKFQGMSISGPRSGRASMRRTRSAVVVNELVEDEESAMNFTFGDADLERISTLYKTFRPNADAYVKDIMRMYRRLAAAKPSPEATLMRYAARIDVYSMGLLLMWVSQFTKEWIEMPRPAILKDYMTWVGAMLHPDPVHRSSMAVAIKAATAWLEKARKA